MSDVAYDGLRSSIIRAEIKPGAAIDEKICMARLGVGRTPLREALQRLVQEDLVTAVPQRGYFVSSTSASDVLLLDEFRQHSEVLAVRLAAARISENQLARFSLLIAEAREGVESNRMDVDWHLQIDERMHRLIAEASGNEYLSRALTRLYALSVRSFYVSSIPVTLIFHELPNFEQIYDALDRRDADLAEEAMLHHLTGRAKSLNRYPDLSHYRSSADGVLK